MRFFHRPRGRYLLYAAVAVLAGGCARRPPRLLRPTRSRFPSASRSSVRSPTSWTSPAGPRRSSRWISAHEPPATWCKMPFEEGAEVKAGDLLFVIDPRPYQAQLDQAAGQVNLYQAQLKLARSTYARDRAINNITPRVDQPATARSG